MRLPAPTRELRRSTSGCRSSRRRTHPVKRARAMRTV